MTTGDEKSDSVRGREIGQTALDSISREFVSVRAGDDLIASQLRDNDLSNDISMDARG